MIPQRASRRRHLVGLLGLVWVLATATGADSVQGVENTSVLDGLDGASSVALTPNGAYVFAVGSIDDALVAFSRDATTGALTFEEVLFDDVGGIDGLDGAGSVTVSPDGRHIYVTGAGDDAVAVFSRHLTSPPGSLLFVEVQKDGVASVDGLDGASSVTVSSDGKHVYAAGFEDDAVAVFSRDAATGALTYVEVQKDGIGGVDGLDGARSVTVSLDGAHVYVAGKEEDAVAVFSRDATTGELTYVQVQKDGIAGVDGLDEAWSVTTSADGAHVYVAGARDDAVAVFSRNATLGALTFVEALFDGVGGVDGLNGARSVTVSGDGAHVYVAANADQAVSVFSRDAATGELTYMEVHKDGVNGVDGLALARWVTVSADGAHVYAAGFGDDAVAVLSREATSGALTFVEAQIDDLPRAVFAGGPGDGYDSAALALSFPSFVNLYPGGAGDGYDSAALAFSFPSFVNLYPGGAGDGYDSILLTGSYGARHVATTGHDAGNDCTNPAQPCATIAHAVAQANAGETLNLAAGTYAAPGVIDKALHVVGAGVIVQ